MLERINIISKWIKHNNASETACLASQKESSNNKQREDDEQNQLTKNCAAFLRHALRRHFSIIVLNPTPIAELAADTAAELKPKAADSIGLTNLGKVSTRIKSGFGMFE